MQTTEELVRWLVGELVKAVEAQVLERMRLALGGLTVPAPQPQQMRATPRRDHELKHVSPGSAESVIDTRRTWTCSQLVKAGGSVNQSGASKALSTLVNAGKLRRVKRGLYEVVGAAPAQGPLPNGVHPGV